MLALQPQVRRMVFTDLVTCLKEWVSEANILSWTSWDHDVLFLFSSPSFPPVAPGTFHAIWTRAWNLYCFSILISAREGFKNCFVEGWLVKSGKHSEASKVHFPLHQASIRECQNSSREEVPSENSEGNGTGRRYTKSLFADGPIWAQRFLTV